MIEIILNYKNFLQKAIRYFTIARCHQSALPPKCYSTKTCFRQNAVSPKCASKKCASTKKHLHQKVLPPKCASTKNASTK